MRRFALGLALAILSGCQVMGTGSIDLVRGGGASPAPAKATPKASPSATPSGGPTATPQYACDKTFDELNTTLDSRLTPDEVRAWGPAAGRDTATAFTKHDFDKDGKLDPDEFCAFLETWRVKPGEPLPSPTPSGGPV